MQVVRLNPANRIGILSLAQGILKRGGAVVYPTETAYGLGADFLSGPAYNRILRIKGRPRDKALPVIIGSARQASSLVEFSPRAWELAERYWPGPLTLVLPLRVKPVHEFFDNDYLAIRHSSHSLAQDLARLLGGPIVATSANLSGQAVCYNIDDVRRQFSGRQLRPDLIIDAGPLPVQPASTLVRIKDGQLEILRAGAIKI